jgi:membrane protein
MKTVVARVRALATWAQGTIPGKVIRRFLDDSGSNHSVLIAWNILTSIFPIALALAGILGLVLRFLGLNSAPVYIAIISVIPGNPGGTTAALEALQRQTGIFLLVGLAGLIWTGSTLFGTIEQAFGRIYKAPPRKFLQQKVMAVGMILLYTVLAGFAVLSSSLLPLLNQIPLIPAEVSNGTTVYWAQRLAAIAAGMVLFGCIYYVVPNRKQRVREIWPGALLAGFGFYLLTQLFPLYLSLNRSIAEYGRLFAFLLIVTTFFYLVGVLTILGAELNAVLYPIPAEQASSARPEAGRESQPAVPDRERWTGGSRFKRVVLAAFGTAVGIVAAARHRGHTAS